MLDSSGPFSASISPWLYHCVVTQCVGKRHAGCMPEPAFRDKSVRSWREESNRSFMVAPLRYFSFQPVLHDWCNKGRGMCYPV